MPKDSPWSNKLKEELFGIQLIKNRKIDHRKDGTKDLCDAVAVVAWHLMSDLSASISGTTIKTENREAKFQQGDANSDIAFGGAGRELAAQIKTSYKGWGTSRNDGGSWSGDDYF